MIRFQPPFHLIHRSTSGRKSGHSLPRLALKAGLGAAVIGAVLAGLSLYVPLMHLWGGDIIAQGLDTEHAVRKVSADNRAAAVNALLAGDPPGRSELPTVNVFADEEDLESLDTLIRDYGFGDLPAKPRIRGLVGMGDAPLIPARVGYRGNNSWHHQAWRPSLKITFRNHRLVDGFRVLHLVAPEDATGIRNWLSADLGRSWGLLSTDERFVRLFLNRRFMGPYLLIRDLDESLLIAQGRLPGSFFRLENGIGPVYLRPFATWGMARHWKVIGMPPAEGMATLQRMLDVVREAPSWASVGRLNRMVDPEATARWLALMTHAGEVHVGADHNIALWLDTTTGKFAPVLIDVNGYGFTHPEALMLDRSIVRKGVPLYDAWLRDPYNLARYVDRLHELVTTFGSAAAIRKRVQAEWGRVRPDALADLHASGLSPEFGSLTRTFVPVTGLDENVERVFRFVERRNETILSRLGRARVRRVRRRESGFEVLVEGLTGCKARNGDGRERILLPSLGEPDKSGERRACAFHALPGRIEDYVFEDRVFGDRIEADQKPLFHEWEWGPPGIHPAEAPEGEREPVALGPGEVTLLESREFAPGQSVTLAAGTTLRLGPGVSLIVQGRLRVAGTKERPVRVRPGVPGHPFGAMVVQGAESAGSRIAFLDMEGGSLDRRENLSYLGMFNVHRCPDIVVENSRFSGNVVGDDAVHIVESHVILRDCAFEGTPADAVDLDRATGSVERCRFRDTGNDGLDLSMGKVRVTDCRFERCGDKGVSVGEGTEADLRRLDFEGCAFGVAVKDRSRVTLSDSRFARCGTAVAAYRKKWRWGKGGSVRVENCVFDRSLRADIATDRRSVLNLGGPLPPGARVVRNAPWLAEAP